MALRDDQVAALRAKLSAKVVQAKVVNGFSLSYVEGWYTIEEANRIFGFDGWDRETVTAECVWQGNNQGVPCASYVARVRVRVHAGDKPVIREGSGFGTGTGNTPGEAHEKAVKEAETDAMKRALATFGNRFGLCLYDKDQHGVAKGKRGRGKDTPTPSTPASGWILKNPEGTALEIIQAPQVFYSKARKMLEALREPTAIKSLWQNNEDALKAIRIAHPDLRDQSGIHYTILFARLCKEQARVAQAGRSAAIERNGVGTVEPVRTSPLTEPTDTPSISETLSGQASPLTEVTDETGASGSLALVQADNHTNEHEPRGIDKSLLPIGVPKRIRDKEHLKAVAQQPCLVCGRSPSHAHHLTFVQPRARGLKTSDEWVVPLCYLHHRELHDRGDEREWWGEKAIDPVITAENIWAKMRLRYA